MKSRMAMPFLGANSASKFAMEAFTDVLRMELRRWGISVLIVEPSYQATPIWEKAVENKAVKDFPQQAYDLYACAIAAACESAINSGKAGIQADFVARAVAHALTANRPKTRYLVGRDAKLAAVVSKFLPDRIRDRLLAQ